MTDIAAIVVILLGALALIGAKILHWVLTVAGVILLCVGVYLAFGGQIGGI
ncbi:MAG: hypothetical protein L3J96_03750 [Thermoplasmata archaeon]|nr:hypothetical protein [Thermoplasmata archaeon]